MAAKEKKKFRFSLSTNILIGMVLGIICGIIFGEYCAFLQIIGDGFIKLLQMTILPYILVSLILGIGGLTYEQAKLMAAKAGILLLFFWAISFALILLLPLSFPAWESAAFFSTSLFEIPEPVDFLQLYIPSNPFYSMANNIVPAVVLFSILLGVALMGIKDKEALLGGLSAAAAALVKVTGIIVKLTPVGVFAISASAAGTMTIDEFGRLQVYLVTFNLAALLLTFGILPLLVMPVTPFRYRDIVGMSKDALVTAFTTGNLFVVLTVLTENCKTLFEKYDLKKEKTDTYIDVLVPISFNFPNTGKLLMLLFIMFAGWFTGSTLSLGQYPMFVVSGLLSFFGGVDVALPFMLDLMQIPADMYQLYLVTGVINGRTATLLGAMNLIVFTLLATASLTGVLKFRMKKLVMYATASAVLILGVIIGSKAYFNFAVKNEYLKDVVIANMQLLENPAPHRLYREVPDRSKSKLRNKTPMERIRITETIRVGYDPDNLPYSYFNTVGDLVGFDIDMAHRLAEDFEWNIEFIPFDQDTMIEQLKRGDFDIIMSATPMTADYLKEMKFSIPYMDATLAFVVPDHLRNKYSTWDNIRKQKKPRIAIFGSGYFRKKLKKAFPTAEIVTLDNPRDFFEENFPNLDAFLMSAEEGSAWTLLYPRFTTVVPKPDIIKIPAGYPIAAGDEELADLVSGWISLIKGSLDFKDRYNYWILGEGAEPKESRWSVVRNIFGWGIEKPAEDTEEQKTEQ